MLTRNLALLALDALGGRISGKTLFIKKVYFLGVLLNKDLGYFAHYYGPYSEEVAGGIIQLKNLGLIEERSQAFGVINSSGFEMRRYDYELTEEGRQAARSLKEFYPEQAAEINGKMQDVENAGSLNYMDLSVAAKAYMILRQSERPLSNRDIAVEASKFAWTVNDQQVQRAVDFLEKLKLVTVSPQG